MENPRILIFDLETSGLDANRGHIMCAVAKWLNDDYSYTWRIDETPGFGDTPGSFIDDSAIVQELVELCTEADAVCAYYGGYGKFDVPYLNTRAVAQNLRPCPPLTVIDPYTTAKGSMKLARNGMASVAEVLNCELQKTHLPWADWIAAQYGDTKAMNKILEYCINDVLVLEELYLKLRPLIRNHPYVANNPEATDEERRIMCPSCGSLKTHGHGSRFTKLFKVFRRRCAEGTCATVFEERRQRVK